MKRSILVPVLPAELPKKSPPPQVALYVCIRACVLRWIELNQDWHKLKPILDDLETLNDGLGQLLTFFQASKEDLNEYLYGENDWDIRLSRPASNSILGDRHWFTELVYEAINFPTHLAEIPVPNEPVVNVVEYPSHPTVTDGLAHFLGDSMGAFFEILHMTTELVSGVFRYAKPTRLTCSQISNDLGHLYLHCDMCDEGLRKHLGLQYDHDYFKA